MKYLQNEESFSFNSTSSKTGLFSDDEGRGTGAVGHSFKRGRIYSHPQNDYFEISLPPPPPPQSSLLTKTNVDDATEEEFEFCSSISSSSTLFSFPVSTSPHPKPPTTNSSIIAALHVQKDYKYHNKINNLFNNQGCMIRSPRSHQGLISPYVDGKQVMRLRIFDENQRNSARFGGLRNFMVKVTSIKSMLRDSNSRRLQQSPIDKVNKKVYMDCKPNNKSDIQRDSSHIATKNNKNQNKQEEKSSRRGFNKMFNVFMKNIGICRRSKQVGSKSCPVSIKSSPMHDTNVGNTSTSDERRNSFYSTDHSIQAAIAHCKKSFGK